MPRPNQFAFLAIWCILGGAAAEDRPITKADVDATMDAYSFRLRPGDIFETREIAVLMAEAAIAEYDSAEHDGDGLAVGQKLVRQKRGTIIPAGVTVRALDDIDIGCVLMRAFSPRLATCTTGPIQIATEGWDFWHKPPPREPQSDQMRNALQERDPTYWLKRRYVRVRILDGAMAGEQDYWIAFKCLRPPTGNEKR